MHLEGFIRSYRMHGYSFSLFQAAANGVSGLPTGISWKCGRSSDWMGGAERLRRLLLKENVIYAYE